MSKYLFQESDIYNGYSPIDYSQVMGDEFTQGNAYLLASISCVQGADYDALQRIILAGLNKEEMG